MLSKAVPHVLLCLKWCSLVQGLNLNMPQIEIPELNPAWRNVSHLMADNQQAIFHPNRGDYLEIFCTDAEPIQWKISGWFSHRNQITILPTKRNLVSNTFTIQTTIELSRFVKLENSSFSFSLRCEKNRVPEIALTIHEFVRGDRKSPLVNLAGSNPANILPCLTSDPTTETILFRTFPDGRLVVVNEVEYFPTRGFISKRNFSGSFVCRQGSFETYLSAIAPNETFPKEVQLVPGQVVSLNCVSNSESDLNFISTKGVEIVQTKLEAGVLARVSIQNVSSLDVPPKVACIASTNGQEELVTEWKILVVPEFSIQLDNFDGEVDCFVKSSPRSLHTLRCRHSSHCDFLEPCLENPDSCNIIERVAYSSDYEDSCRNWATSEVSTCVAVKYSHLNGLAVCKAGNAMQKWLFFVSLNYLKYTNWRDALLSELIRMDEVKPVLYTNNTNAFFCEAVSFLFANSLTFQIEFKNGTRIITENGQAENFTIENPEREHPRRINDLNFIGVLNAKLPLDAVAVHCIAPWNNETGNLTTHRRIVMKHLQAPELVEAVNPHMVFNVEDTGRRLVCPATGEPDPVYTWFYNDQSVEISRPELKSIVGSNKYGFLEFPKTLEPISIERYSGTFLCTAKNSNGEVNSTIFLTVTDKPTNNSVTLLSLIGVGSFVVVMALGCGLFVTVQKYKKMQELVRDLTDKEIEEFFQGNPELLRTTGNAYDQIDFLPYRNDFEITEDDLEIDKSESNILGSGHFSNVVQGKILSQGIPVAIKISKPNVDVTLFKTLLREVKIMIYIGSHENILKLVGVCTANIRNQTIKIATQICELGSLDIFLRENTKNFQNLLNANQQIDKSGYTSSVGLCTLDLVEFAAQIARGMSFLADKSVIHGDLATRNILLTSERGVKISDFGLSKQLYEGQNYVKKSKTPLPWRWMAIESLKTLTFSTKSDVWAYGVTLFEIFSLGGVPFPNEEWNQEFMTRLSSGMRMGRPTYSPLEIYSKMITCWENEPDHRPDFPSLTEFFTNILARLEFSPTNGAFPKHVQDNEVPRDFAQWYENVTATSFYENV